VSGVASLVELTRDVGWDRFERSAVSSNTACTLAPDATIPFRNYSRMDAPDFAPKSRRRFMAPLQYQAEPVRLYSLKDVRFYGSPGLFVAGNAIVAESAAHWRLHTSGTAEEIVTELRAGMGQPLLDFEAPLQRLEGAHVLAASLYSRNYFHWTYELLPAIALLAELGAHRGLKVLVDRRTEVVDASLGALGIPPQDIVILPRKQAVAVDRLLVASCFRSESPRIHPRILQALQRIKKTVLGEPQPRPGRRIFASRGTSDLRRLDNRQALESAFEAEGFEIVDPGMLGYADQLRLFDEADVVVAEHGANLGNIVFCRPGTLVLELFHPSVGGWGSLCFLAIAEAMGLLHRSLVGRAGLGDRWTVDALEAVEFLKDTLRRRAAHEDRLRVALAAGD